MKLDAFQLKIIALITMTIDHIGYFLFPQVLWLRIIGRISFVIFAYLIANAYYFTSNKNKYFYRLLIFGLILDLIVFLSGNLESFNIFITMALGFRLIDSIQTKQYPLTFFIIISSQILLITTGITYQYGLYGILFILSSYYLYKKPHILIIVNLLLIYLTNFIEPISYIQYYSIMGTLLICFYSYQKGKSMKYFFYFYYPIHVAILSFLSTII